MFVLHDTYTEYEINSLNTEIVFFNFLSLQTRIMYRTNLTPS